jgi:hypothetical protein
MPRLLFVVAAVVFVVTVVVFVVVAMCCCGESNLSEIVCLSLSLSLLDELFSAPALPQLSLLLVLLLVVGPIHSTDGRIRIRSGGGGGGGGGAGVVTGKGGGQVGN